MGERFKSQVTKPFLHGCDAAYRERIATSDLLSQCRHELILNEYTVCPNGHECPTEGTPVALFNTPQGIVAVVGTEKIGTIDSSDTAALLPVLEEVGGVLCAVVSGHAAIGDCFTVRVNDPGRDNDADR